MNVRVDVTVDNPLLKQKSKGIFRILPFPPMTKPWILVQLYISRLATEVKFFFCMYKA